MVADFDELLSFVWEKYREAKDGTANIVFPVEKYAANQAGRGAIAMSEGLEARAPSITDYPQFQVLKHATGLSAWAIVLAVDMRQSSRTAVRLGAENTFITMHTYIPTMAHLVELSGGSVIGLRGDGLFAGFGVTELVEGEEVVTPAMANKAVRSAVHCGKAMIEAVEDAINVVLRRNDIGADIAIGVGVDVGNVVITRIGYDTASEITAYGAPVDRACKTYSDGTNKIHVSRAAWDMFPSSKGGRVSAELIGGKYVVGFPGDMQMLGGECKFRRPKSLH